MDERERSELKSERAELPWKVTELTVYRKYGAQKLSDFLCCSGDIGPCLCLKKSRRIASLWAKAMPHYVHEHDKWTCIVYVRCDGQAVRVFRQV